MILMVAKEDGAVYTADVTSWLIPRGRGAPSRLLRAVAVRAVAS